MAGRRGFLTDVQPDVARVSWSAVLRALREAAGLPQQVWADLLGVGRTVVRRWESGEAVPNADAEQALVALCRE